MSVLNLDGHKKQQVQCRAVIETVRKGKFSYFRSHFFVYTEYTLLLWHSSSPQTYDFLGFCYQISWKGLDKNS